METERRKFTPQEMESKENPVYWLDRTPEDKKDWIAKAYSIHRGEDISSIALGYQTKNQTPSQTHEQRANEMYEIINNRIEGILERYKDSTEIHVNFFNPDYVSTQDPVKNHGFEIQLSTLMFALGMEEETYDKLINPRAIKDVTEESNFSPNAIQEIANLTNKGVLIYAPKPESPDEYVQMGGVAPDNDRNNNIIEKGQEGNFIVFDTISTNS